MLRLDSAGLVGAEPVGAEPLGPEPVEAAGPVGAGRPQAAGSGMVTIARTLTL